MLQRIIELEQIDAKREAVFNPDCGVGRLCQLGGLMFLGKAEEEQQSNRQASSLCFLNYLS